MMNKKITYLALALILLVVFVQDSIARTIPQSNSNPLLKRGEDDSVCIVAKAVFDDEITGIITFAEKEKGCTFVFGLFSKGLDDPEKNCFNVLIEDCDGKVVANLTDSIEFVDGGTKPFFTKIDLDLDDLVGSSSGDKRKRQIPGTGTAEVESVSGDIGESAPIERVF
ncbi:hypothetical protein F8M41_011756 [Gigaspora margarita]|uniref:Uncharacterized protein n=1 Tax=Gigaspora margarita TaxID=4874 RepID=A0A8H4B421_GIGMA|nr:hypothetical protein F8M41_011756 [Gigaspora margarita]